MKKLKIILLVIIIALFIGNGIYAIKVNESKIIEACVNSDLITLEQEIEGMKVTLLGGSNQGDKGNIRSMGYFIRTRNNEVIFVDGGISSDYESLKSYIDKYTVDGKVNHWIITHGHDDHVGAFLRVLSEENNITIENLYYNFLTEDWYKANDARGYESEKAFLDSLSSSKILKHNICKKGEKYQIDNIEMEIIRVADPKITNGDNGNEASMVFKLTATDVNLSMVFLGDAMTKASPEILENKELLKADAVQMAHHGNWGVTKEVYEAIDPTAAFYNATDYLYNNDQGGGFNTGKWDSVKVRGWLDEIGVEKRFLAFEGDQVVHFNRNGINLIQPAPAE